MRAGIDSGTRVWKRAKALLTVALLAGPVTGCGGGEAGAGEGAAKATLKRAPGGIDEGLSHFEISGFEEARSNPRVSVHFDPGKGEGLFSDGVTRYQVRMLPEDLEKDDLTIWIDLIREDSSPGRIEVTDKLDTPTIMVGVGRGLVKGYKKVRSGHLDLERLDGVIALTFEAELESQSVLDRERKGQSVTVRGRVIDAMMPSPSGGG